MSAADKSTAPTVTLDRVAAVFVGGAVGGVVRIVLDLALPTVTGHWPWSTLIVNLAGAAILGNLGLRWHVADPDAARRHPFWLTGFCGALTTFSALQVQLVEMLQDGYLGMAALYASLSLVGGVAAVNVGRALVGKKGQT